jgi:formimidoylglutamate deiminase
MTTIRAKQALLQGGWAEDIEVEIDASGRIARVGSGQGPGEVRVDILLPAPANCHSHAFQRAMAGLSERRGPNPTDSFWTWRELMFRFLDRIDPDQIEAIAAFVQMEMLEAGFSACVEFHYLHHQPGGAPYARLAETSERVAAAAVASGIGLTLLPVLYRFGGCDRRPLGPGQIRFGNDPDRYARLVEEARQALGGLPEDAVLGTAPHSLRAVAPEDIAAVAALTDGPVHMHLAEQIPEVEEVQAAYRARPVEWALDHLGPDPRWCLIHCTQMEPHETEGLAATGAVAGLCPLTEANLGDGIFDGVRWMAAEGRIAVGSDSNIRIALAEELRQLDTTQRLRDHTRAALATPERSTGRRLWDAVCTGGAQAAGRGRGAIAGGEWADLLALDARHPDLAGLRGDTILDAFAFAGGNGMVRDVWSAGRHLVQEGRHVRRSSIRAAYGRAVAPLRDGL